MYPQMWWVEVRNDILDSQRWPRVGEDREAVKGIQACHACQESQKMECLADLHDDLRLADRAVQHERGRRTPTRSAFEPGGR